MSKTIIVYSQAFLIGAMLSATPFLLSGHFANAAETARGEPTMGPGITTALGLLAAPLGGLAAVAATAAWRRRKPSP